MAQTTNVASSTNPYLYGANADATNTATLYAQAELGQVFYNSGNRYQRAQSDSGATSATPVGAIASGQVAFWVDKGKKIVTNDKRFAGVGSPATVASNSAAVASNLVAGFFRVAATPGNYVDILNKGNGVLVASDGNGAIGDNAIADTSASVARVTNVSAGTAVTYMSLGIIRKASAASLITVDVDIDPVD